MIPKLLSEIGPADFQDLIDGAVREGKNFEYKRDMYGRSDADKKELLADVSSFANAGGGDLIIGVDENDGVPVGIPGVDTASLDQEKQRLENIIRTGLEPRLPSVEIRPVPLESKKWVIVIRVRKSWNGPHRVSYQDHAKFYGRNSAGKYPLDVSELRTAFTLAENIADRIRNFRADRIAKIYAYETPVPIAEGARVVLHLVPLSGFAGGAIIDIPSKYGSTRDDFLLLGGSRGDSRLNLDGFIRYLKRGEAYTQFYRTGIVEAARVYGSRILSQANEDWIIDALRGYLQGLRKLGIEPPIFVFLALLGVANCEFAVSDRISFWSDDPHAVDRDELILPEVVIDDYDKEPAAVLKPVFDMVWNAWGYLRSFNYDEQGNWVGQR